MNSIDLSIIVPMYNEEEVVEIFFKEITNFLNEFLSHYSYEILCINDGSKDNTLHILKSYAQKDKRIKIISFSRNFGKERAMYSGLNFCNGKAAIIIDVDLQDPIELILDFVKKWESGFDNIYGLRHDRKSDTFLKRFTAHIFYKIANKISDVPIVQNAGDFRLIDRKVIEAIKQIYDKKLFMKYIFNWSGYKSLAIPYSRKKRAAGKTKFNYWKLLNFALDGITASTTIPLRIWSYVGLFIVSISFIRGVYIMVRTIVDGVDLPGYASLFTAIVFFGGIQLISLGIIGEYLGRILEETRKRPLCIIDETINL
jgi:glycosyltransferase involved in cell wall biosynthesis